MKTIFFDFGNVIGFFDHQRAVAKFTQYSVLPPTELTLLLYGSTIEEDYEAGKLTTAEYRRLAKLNARLNCTDEQFHAAFIDIFWRNDEVCDLIPLLKPHYQIGLASNTNDAHFTQYCQQFQDTLQLFDVLCPSHQVGHRKPHYEYFEYCQKQANAEPGQCVFVDDLPVNIEAAEKFGWHGILYRPGENLKQKLNDLGIVLASG